jgi:hypothetical protein
MMSSVDSRQATDERPAAVLEPATALLGSAAVIVWNDVAPEGQQIFYAWHDNEHIPERLAIPGFLRGRRYRCAGHSPEWLTFYEAGDLGVLVSPAYMARLNAPSEETTRALRYFRNTSRAVCRISDSAGNSNGGYVAALRIGVQPAQTSALVKFIREHALAQAMSVAGVLACHLFAADQQASHLDTAESSTRTFDVPSWVLLAEASHAHAAQQALAILGGERMRALGASVRADAAVYTLEISRLSSVLTDRA